jgi:SAM-dependent methyltransferase
MSIRDDLRTAYDRAAALRERSEVDPWKVDERDRFLALLRVEGATTLLEVGAGTGVHGAWFTGQGLRVVATDLSPALVELCRAKGLEAYEMDFLSLKFEQPFDAAFGMNCLLHVPRSELPETLQTIAACLKPGGLAYFGQYGGIDREGPWESDQSYNPPRYFAHSTDEAMLAYAGEVFEVVDIHTIAMEHDDPTHFQALTLRRP